MNLLTINKIKKLITKEKDKNVSYYRFVPQIETQIQNSLSYELEYEYGSGYSNCNNTKIEKMREESKKIKEIIKQKIKKLYEDNNPLKKILFKNKAIYFFHIKIESNDNFLMIEDAQNNKLFFNFNQGISIYSKNKGLLIKNGGMEEFIEIKGLNETESTENKDIDIKNNMNKYQDILKDIFEIIIVNKDYY